MKNILFILLLFTSTAHSASYIDNMLIELEGEFVFNYDTETAIPFKDFTEIVREDSPAMFRWCRQKAEHAKDIMDLRSTHTLEEMLGRLEGIRKSNPYYVWVDYQRMTRDAYRLTRKLEFRTSGDEKGINDFVKKELKYCLIYKF